MDSCLARSKAIYRRSKRVILRYYKLIESRFAVLVPKAGNQYRNRNGNQ